MNAAIAIGSAILPTLIAAIQEGLDAGLSEEEATRRALERMRSTTLPSPLAAETRAAFATARAALPSTSGPTVHASDLEVLERVALSRAWSREERDALERGIAALQPLAVR